MSTGAAPTAPLLGNERIGRYELLGEIASGGMATVYLGRSLGAKGFSRLVAIKKLHPHLEKEEAFVSMFLDEARLAARIRHPNVVPTLDVDDREGLYIVMEYVEGDRLLGLLKFASKKKDPIPRGIALRIAVESLQGLHAAHEMLDDDGNPLNLVHRDVSPQNVLIGVDGITKITDFGIAKAESRLTQTRDGQLKGKIPYMAPEQTRGSMIDRRVDVFAMGILAWEMFASRRLFRGENDVQILSAVVNERIPTISSVRPGFPLDVEAVVMKALDREPDNRFSSAAEFAEALEAVAASVGGMASTRVVAAYVLAVAGPKLESERARIKSGVPIVGHTEHPSHPSQAALESSSRSAIRPVETVSTVGAVQSQQGPRSRLATAAVLIAVACLGASVAFWVATSRRNDSATTRTAVEPPAVVTAPPAVVVPANVPVNTIAAVVPPVPVADAGSSPAAHVAPAVTDAHPRTTVRRTRRRTGQPHTGGGGEDEFDPVSANPYRR